MIHKMADFVAGVFMVIIGLVIIWYVLSNGSYVGSFLSDLVNGFIALVKAFLDGIGP